MLFRSLDTVEVPGSVARWDLDAREEQVIAAELRAAGMWLSDGVLARATETAKR